MKLGSSMKQSLFLTAVLLCMAVGAQAATWYVSTSGDDVTGNGSQANPYKTINKAIQAASAGDEIIIAAGTYPETSQTWVDIELLKSLKLVGAGSGQTIVEFSAKQHGMEIRPDATGTVWIEGISFTKNSSNAKSADWAVLVGETGGTFSSITFKDVEIAYAQARNLHFAAATYASIVIEDCDIHHSGGWGCSMRGTLTSVIITNSDFRNCGWNNAAEGIGFDIDVPPINVGLLQVTGGNFSYNTAKGINLLKTTNAIFDGVTASNNSGASGGGFGVSIWEWNSISSNLVFKNSTFSNNALDGFLFGTEGTTSIQDVTIENCFLHGNGRSGVFMYGFYGGTVSGIAFNKNSFSSNGVNLWSDYAALIDASGNWWGTSASPATVAATMTGSNFDFTPYLAAGTDVEPATTGFQPDMSELYVTLSGAQSGGAGRIQEGVDLVSGSTVHVTAGAYTENIEIDKDLTLKGEGASSTTIVSPNSLPISFVTGSNNNRAIIYVHDAAEVKIEDLTVDGASKGNANFRFIGVAYRNAGGGVSDCNVIDIKDTPFSGAQHGVAVYAYADNSTSRNLMIDGCVITGFQKNGMVLIGQDLTVSVSGCTVTGVGGTSVTAQNGIQVGTGAVGELDGNIISGIAYHTTPSSDWCACGILIYDAGAVDVNNSEITDCQVALYHGGTGGMISGNSITTDATTIGTTDYVTGIGIWPVASASYVVVGNTVVGDGTYGTGIDLYPDGTDVLDATVAQNTVEDWEYGVWVGKASGATVDAAVNNNMISGSAALGLYNTAGVMVDATGNWWGSNDGPADANGTKEMPFALPATVAEMTNTETTAGNGVTDNLVNYYPWNALDIPVAATATDYVSPANGVSLNFSILPAGGGEVSIKRFLSAPYGFPAAPAGAAIGSYLVLTSDMANYSFNVTVTLNDLPAGFSSTATLAYYNSATTSWVPVGGVFTDVAPAGFGPEDTYAFTTNHFTPFTFINTPSTPYDLYVSSSPTVFEGGIVYPNTNWAPVPTAYEPDDWGWSGIEQNSFYLVPGGGSQFGACDLTVQWDDGYMELVGVDFGSAGTPNGLFGSGQSYMPQAMYNLLGSTDKVRINCSRLDNNNFTTISGDYIAKLTFKTLKPGYAPVTVISTDFRYYNPSAAPSGVYMIPTEAAVKAYLGDFADDKGTPATTADDDQSTGDGNVNYADLVPWSLSYWSGVPGYAPGMTYYKLKYDIGPTTDAYVWSLPTVDNMIEFEDLVIFAIMYGKSAANELPKLEPARNTVVVRAGPAETSDRETRVPLYAYGDGVRALRVDLEGRYGRFLGVESGSGLAFGLDACGKLRVDVATPGRDLRLGDEPVAVLRFESVADLRVSGGDARDARNSKLHVVSGLTPEALTLEQNYPNPFNPSTTILYATPQSGHVRLEVYTMLGERAAILVDGAMEAGTHAAVWNGRDDSGRELPSGQYICRLTSGGLSIQKTMSLMK